MVASISTWCEAFRQPYQNKITYCERILQLIFPNLADEPWGDHRLLCGVGILRFSFRTRCTCSRVVVVQLMLLTSS
jgi:hypothetical protein